MFLYLNPTNNGCHGTKIGHVDISEWVYFKKLSSILEIFEARLASYTMVKTVFEHELVAWLLHLIMAAVQEINGPDPDLFLSGLFLRW